MNGIVTFGLELVLLVVSVSFAMTVTHTWLLLLYMFKAGDRVRVVVSRAVEGKETP